MPSLATPGNPCLSDALPEARSVLSMTGWIGETFAVKGSTRLTRVPKGQMFNSSGHL
jgi:hypothetical protein